MDSAATTPASFTLTLDENLTVGTIKLNASGGHTGTFTSDGTHVFTLDNTGGTATNIFGDTNASIGENANSGVLTVGPNIVIANTNLDIGSPQKGTVSITGNITASTAQTLNLENNQTTGTTTIDAISGNIGASGSAIAIVDASTGSSFANFNLTTGTIGGASGTGAAVTITNQATGASPFAISSTLGATVSSITQNSTNSIMTISGTNSSFTGTTSIQAGTLTLGSTTALGNSAVKLANTSGATLNLTSSTTIGSLAGGGTTGGNVTLNANTLSVGSNNTSTSYAGVISGTGGLTKIGSGVLTLTGANSYPGSTTVNAGTLKLDFTASGAPTTNIINNTPLNLGGGTLSVVGNSASSTQSFGSWAVAAGASTISATGSASVSLATITLTAGAGVVFSGPLTTTYATNGSGVITPTTVNATGTITTSSTGLTAAVASGGGLLAGGNNTNNYATVGLYDWASTDTAAGAAGSTIIGGSQVSGFYTVPGNNAGNTFTTPNLDIATQQAPTLNGTSDVRISGGNAVVDSIRFNSGHAPYITVSNTLATGGVLVTPNMGQVNAGIDQIRLNGAVSTQIVQNNTLGVFVLGLNGKSDFATGNAGDSVVISGSGAVFLNPVAGTGIKFNYLSSSGVLTNSSSGVYDSAQINSAAQGPTYINGGVTVINTGAALSNPATVGTTGGSVGSVNLNGGTLMGAINSFSLISAGTNVGNRAVFLGSNGGGLAAQFGTTLTIPGVISGAAGSGPLTIGIAGSTANGNVAGLVPGTGTGTANPAFSATGTVLLNNANTFAGGTTIMTGTLRTANASTLGSGTVAINSTATLAVGADASTVGNLTTGGQTWNTGGTYTAKIVAAGTGSSGTPTAQAGGTNWDLINMSGLTVASTNGSPFTITLTAPSATGGFTKTLNYDWVIASVGSASGISNGTLATASNTGNPGTSGLFTLDTSNFVTANGGSFPIASSFSLQLDGLSGSQTLDVVYNATPEPGTALLVLGGALPMILGRRRRAKRIENAANA